MDNTTDPISGIFPDSRQSKARNGQFQNENKSKKEDKLQNNGDITTFEQKWNILTSVEEK